MKKRWISWLCGKPAFFAWAVDHPASLCPAPVPTTKTIATGLCPGGRLRMERLLRVLKINRVDPTAMTSHTFTFDEMERAFEIADKKLDDVVKALIMF